jgi:hypothetical protein
MIDRQKHLLLFFLALVIGQVVVLGIVEEGVTLYGVTADVNLNDKTITLASREVDGNKYRFSFDEKTVVSKRDLVQDSEGVFYSESGLLPDSIQNIHQGDRVLIFFARDITNGTFYATHILRGNPFPEF